MRRLLTSLVVLVTVGAMPALALADNQGVANDIAKNLRDSGRREHYKIGVKYQDGTVWVRGYVANQQQMATALTLAAATEGVERVVNELQIGVPKTQSQSQAVPKAETVANAPTPLALKSTSLKADDSEQVQNADLSTEPASEEKPQSKIRMVAQPVEEPVEQARQMQTLGKPTGQAKPATPIEQFVGLPAKRHAPQQLQGHVPQQPLPAAYIQAQPMPQPAAQAPGGPMPAYVAGTGGGVAPVQYDHAHMPNHAWPSYAAYPNYAALTYPRQHSPAAWPYIGPFYPYPQVPLGWRKVTLEWDDGWWMLDFCDSPRRCKW